MVKQDILFAANYYTSSQPKSDVHSSRQLPAPMSYSGASRWPIMLGEMARAIRPLHVSYIETPKWLTDSAADQPLISPHALQEG